MSTLYSLFNHNTGSANKPTTICARTGVAMQWEDELGMAQFVAMPIHPYFANGNYRNIQTAIHRRDPAVTKELTAAAIVYELTDPKSSVLTHTDITCLYVLNQALTQNSPAFLTRLYKAVCANRNTTLHINCADMVQDFGLDKFALTLLKLLFTNYLSPTQVLLDRAETEHSEGESEAAAERANAQDTLERRINSVPAKDAWNNMQPWLFTPLKPKTPKQPWKNVIYAATQQPTSTAAKEAIGYLEELFKSSKHEFGGLRYYRAAKCIKLLKEKYQSTLDREALAMADDDEDDWEDL